MMELLFQGCSQSCMNHSSQAPGRDLCCYSIVVRGGGGGGGAAWLKRTHPGGSRSKAECWMHWCLVFPLKLRL